ncbi:aminopeptidase P family protein [Oryzifoliimicrobium ureilyticus]|uniref:aminopeptidase P family protein n=1 Tax=Oryzifoliimicrobium ureilyticus TaxID=3113724 RepID=UPI0030765B41
MFQSFEVTSTPQFGRERVDALRASFDELGIDAFLVPRADEYNGEYVPPSAERLAWLTGFTGSAGVALITRNQAIVFVDGRYVTQLAEQVDGSVFIGGDLVGEPPAVWLSRHGSRGLRLGIDPWLHAGTEVRRLAASLAEIGGALVILPHNPLDRIWANRPAEPKGAVVIQRIDHAGLAAEEKIRRIAEDLATRDHQAVLIADPSSVAWIFNIRGSDVPHTPHPLARAIVHCDGKAELFLDKDKTNAEVKGYLAGLCDQHAPDMLVERLQAVAANGAKIAVDPDIASYALGALIEQAGGKLVESSDPAKLPRAVKNKVELEGSAKAHLQDGAAVTEFLCWLASVKDEQVTEIHVAEKLEATRAKVGQSFQNPLKDISFDTIAGAGEHAAIMHYRVTTASDRHLKTGELFLIDSGAQYINGTTDITRTVGIGAVDEEKRRFFTLVLKGMIAISTARFPKGTRGCDLDPLARISLWKAGVDFAHGTGHGVGSYLSVHEGPQRIARLSTQELLPGMILSNEPGYYRPGSFGIRIENLIYVKEAEAVDGGDIPMLGFETLTFCPIDRNLVQTNLLTSDELAWLNAYHQLTREKLMPLLQDENVKRWLEGATQPL